MLALRIPLIALGCAALYALWRWTTRGGGRAAAIVTGGLLLRAIVAQTLFWISWLRLPVARSLQLGDGFWFFAIDGPGYIEWGTRFVRHTLPESYPSRFFVQLLGVFVALFGAFASTAILLNCLAYLATCAVVIAIARKKTSGALLFTLAAIAFGPSMILWSLQPLKDTLFALLVTATVGACAWWKDAATPLTRAASAVAMIPLAYAIASLRWYFAVFLWGAWGLYAIWVVAKSPRKLRASAGAVVVFLLLGGAIAFGAHDDLPALWRGSPVERIAHSATTFGSVPGATTIRPGERVQATPPPPVAQPQPIPRPAPAPQPMPPPTPLPAAPSTPPPSSPQPAAQPAKIEASRFVADAAATFLPRFIAQPLGLMQVGGGRGFWLLVDADTLVFDLVVLFAIVYAVRARARTPLFLMLVLLFVMTALPMVYVVNNFGTLFRLREMLYLLAALVPVTIARDAKSASVQPARSR
jgi:hypothetical protein